MLYIENPDGERYQLWYDAAGNRLAERNFAGHLRRHTFNGANFPYSTMLPDESGVTPTGSADGSTLTSAESPRGAS
ncbi:MAG TPA: hypothetical protein ENK57_24030 [Polyangiaceae bacterium]|nr:hypothetical protein [Polyangiaceae bacterium]